MANPKLSTLVDAFTGTTINTSLWNSITPGTATLDTLNNLVTLKAPTTNGSTNTFGSTTPFDATASSVSAQIGVAPNGNGGTRTIFKLLIDSNNSIAMRLESGVFKLTVQTAGTTVTTTLTGYDPNAHRWWRLRESGGTFYAEAAPDGATWATLASSAYSWSATGMQLMFQAGASTTEVAGNVAWIAHVNTPLGGQLNPNWPALRHAWGPRWATNNGLVPLDQYVDVSAQSRGQTGVQRGRQYELDQVRSGEVSTQWANALGQFDAGNTAGPWYGHVQLFTPYRLRAQWPATINLLTQVQATGGDQGGYSAGTIPQGPTGIAVVSGTDSTGGAIVASTSAWLGGSVFQFNVPAATASGTGICSTAQPPVQPGATYTEQIQVRNVTSSTSLSVQAFIAWYSAAGTLISTSTGASTALTGGAAPAWTQLTVTGSAPSNVAYWYVGVQTAATSPGSTVAVQVDGWQVEQGSTASVWMCPGVWYPVYSGFVERLPQQWAMSGTYGTVTPEVYDAFALLSQRQLRDPLTEEIYKRAPRFVYALSDPQGSSYVTDQVGNVPLAQIAISKDGAGSLTLGTQITAANTVTGVYTGSTGTVATINNPNPGTGTVSAATYVDLTFAGIKGPAGGTWSRAIAFRYTGPTPTTGNQAVIWMGLASNYQTSPIPGGAQVGVYIDQNGHVNAVAVDSHTAGGTMTNTSVNVVDSNWHLVIWGAKSGNAFLSVDGSYTSSASGYSLTSPLVNDSIGAWVDPSIGSDTWYNYKGDLSFAIEWPSYLGSTDCSTIYAAWRSCFAGESSDTRWTRILGWAGFGGTTSTQSGLTTAMGSAANVAGQDALSALQAVIDTENGSHFVARDGTLTFKARSDRYNKLTPMYVFGERTDLGELSYEGLQVDYDSTRIANLVTITQQSTSQTFVGQDTTSTSEYWPRPLTRTINTASTQECQDAANYLASRYRQPARRISQMTLHPSANPALWPVCLSLELGTRIRVNRRAPGVTTQAIDAFAESLQWRFDDKGEAYLALQCSPVDQTPYGIFAAFHTTLNATIASGVSSITINAGADNTNPAAAQLGTNQQLVLGLGTANQETVTIQSVAATSPGWTTAVITMTAPTTKSHTAGDTVCEPLPTGITDPTTYDSAAKFDSCAFAY